MGEDGRVYAAVQYPSMSELWPDVYRTKAVRVVQVSRLNQQLPRPPRLLQSTLRVRAERRNNMYVRGWLFADTFVARFFAVRLNNGIGSP